MSEIKIGDKIQDFRLRDQEEKEVCLYDFAGKKVLLSFHPLAWTSVCAEQMKSLEENYETFTRLNTAAFGISVDTTPSKKAWAKEQELNTLNFFRTSGLMGKLPEHVEYSGKKKASLKEQT
jgi:peroxiredoxin